ncbi:HIT family protein [Rhabdaerophilum calidifontis]|uniref:HIT family protein n=1 Tax=Rhabdaerophilum calidifontis TaxID=2604328 RepID=UPI00123B7C8D|nr:HIT family protein [Rhabdaerophilum calidifontis]
MSGPDSPAQNAAYDNGNVFAKILRGELPCHRVYEDEVVLAFMDIMPRSPGHLLVIPKAPARNLLDADPETLAAMLPRVQRIARAAMAALGAEGITLQQFSESAGGQEVFHLHFHILPRWEGQRIHPHPAPKGDMAVLAEQAGKIRAALGQ